MGALLALIGVGVGLVGWYQILSIAFEESLIWGFLAIFIHPVALVIVVTHWEDARKPFFMEIGGLALFILGCGNL